MRHQTNQIVSLALGGMAPRDIASKVHVEPAVVYSALKYARKQGHKIPFYAKCTETVAVPPLEMTTPILVTNRLHALLVREAQRRGKTINECAQRLLEDVLLKGGRQ